MFCLDLVTRTYYFRCHCADSIIQSCCYQAGATGFPPTSENHSCYYFDRVTLLEHIATDAAERVWQHHHSGTGHDWIVGRNTRATECCASQRWSVSVHLSNQWCPEQNATGEDCQWTVHVPYPNYQRTWPEGRNAPNAADQTDPHTAEENPGSCGPTD